MATLLFGPASTANRHLRLPDRWLSVAPTKIRVLDDRQYVYQASSDVNGGTVTVGYPYSLLEWCVEPHTSWSLPIDARRVPSTQTAQAVGAEQIQALASARSACLEALDIIAADGKYGNAGFLRSVKGLRCGILARLRCDRVLYALPPPPAPHKKRPSQSARETLCLQGATNLGNPY